MIFPTYDKKNLRLVSGSVYLCTHICEQNKEKCREYYRSLKCNGIYTCPYGFTTFIVDTLIVSGIGVNGYCQLQKIKKNGYEYRIFFKSEIDAVILLECSIGNLKKQIETQDILLRELFHDVRQVNGTAKNNCQELLDSTDDSDIKKKSLLNILDATNLISLRLDYYSFLINPDSIDKFETIGIYRLFERSVQLLYNKTHDKLINVNLGKCWKAVKGSRILSLIAYAILDNAVKYAPKNSDIQITFQEIGNICIATIISLGPKVEPEELNLIFDSGYRGLHAREIRYIQGAGLGLSVVKDICDRHKYSVSVTSKEQVSPQKNKDYWQFSISIEFSDTFILE